MNKNDQKWLNLTKSGEKWFNTTRNKPKRPSLIKAGQIWRDLTGLNVTLIKHDQLPQNCHKIQKRPKLTKSEQIPSKIDWKWPTVAKSDHYL